MWCGSVRAIWPCISYFQVTDNSNCWMMIFDVSCNFIIFMVHVSCIMYNFHTYFVVHCPILTLHTCGILKWIHNQTKTYFAYFSQNWWKSMYNWIINFPSGNFFSFFPLSLDFHSMNSHYLCKYVFLLHVCICSLSMQINDFT